MSDNLLNGIHHIAIICSDYQQSKKFYTEVLGFDIVNETYRKERDSYKLDLALNAHYTIELFSFPHPRKDHQDLNPADCDIWLLKSMI